jgi:hypothetical protein
MISLSKIVNETRAIELAVLHLTRDPDFVVKKNVLNSEMVDLVVSLKKGINLTPLFMVNVKAVKNISDYKKYITFNNREKGFIRASEFPVVLFVFDMSDDKGYYAMLNSPSPNDESTLVIQALTNIRLMKITRIEIAKIKDKAIRYSNTNYFNNQI